MVPLNRPRWSHGRWADHFFFSLFNFQWVFEFRKQPTLNSYQSSFLLKAAMVYIIRLRISSCRFPKFSYQSKSVSHCRRWYSLFSIRITDLPIQFPIVEEVALYIMGRWLVSRYHLYKGYRRNL